MNEKKRELPAERIDRDAAAREAERILREREVIAALSGEVQEEEDGLARTEQ